MVTALREPSALFREEQNFAWWLYALLATLLLYGLFALAGVPVHVLANPAPIIGGGGGGGGAGWGPDAQAGLVFGLTLPTMLVVGVLRMTTEVDDHALKVWFGWIPTYRRTVAVADISSLEIVQYRPLRDCGGWGIRRGRGGELVLNARGDRGVRITLVDGSKLLIGSQRPEELAGILQRSLRPGV